jgi:hypothetical protein
VFLPADIGADSARSVLIFVVDDGQPMVWAASIDGAPKIFELEADVGDETVALLYREDLETLDFVEGPLELPMLGESARRPPAFYAAARASEVGSDWAPLAAPPGWVLEASLPSFAGAGCLARGRCIDVIGEDLVCVADCVAPTLAPPAAPISPAPPNLGPCPPGWARDERASGTIACVPAGAIAACVGLEAPFVHGCRAVGVACAGGRPSGPGIDVTPGDGTLAAAALAAGPGATLLLSAGVYRGGVTFPADQVVRGCAAETLVELGAITTSADLRFESLTLGATIAVASGDLSIVGVRIEGAIRIASGASSSIEGSRYTRGLALYSSDRARDRRHGADQRLELRRFAVRWARGHRTVGAARARIDLAARDRR